MIVSVFCRFRSQNNSEFDAFLLNIEQLLSNLSKRKPTMSIITGDFNARSSSWWSDVIDTPEGTNLYWLTSSNGFSQLINELNHIQTNDSSVLMLFLLMNQICQWILEFVHLYTLIVITRLYRLALILIFL